MDILRYHKLSEKDQNSQRLAYFTEEKRLTFNFDYVEVIHSVVPRDLILVVTSWAIESSDNGSSAWSGVFWSLTSESEYELLDVDNVDAGRTKMYYSIKKEHVIMPNDRPAAWIRFDAAAPNNTVFSRIRGFYIPKGNLGLGFGG